MSVLKNMYMKIGSRSFYSGSVVKTKILDFCIDN